MAAGAGRYVSPTSQPKQIGGLTRRLDKVEKRIAALTPAGVTQVWGAVYNDGDILSGVGFTVFCPVMGSSAWSNATAYAVGDIVYHIAGTTYICVRAHTNHSPPNATYWSPAEPYGAQYLVVFDTPFVNPPVVILSGNNNNAPNPSTPGRYTVTRLDTYGQTGYFLAITRDIDSPASIAQDGGFDFLAIEPGV